MAEVKRVILYKHGMGYFEREARVNGQDVCELDFKKEEMNDVLKSLTVFDSDGGTVTSISYDATRPVAEELADIALDLPEKDSLSGLLAGLKGCQVQVRVGGREISGDVMGLESVRLERDGTFMTQKRLVLWTTELQIRHFALDEIDHFSILDERVRADLGRLLETVPYWKKKDLKRLSIFTKGEGERRLWLSYTVASPVWKTSYRILLGKDRAPLLSGWAMVDNTGQEAWEDVRLSLVAGMPVSFVHDLYSPRFRRRPEILVQDDPAYGAPVLEQPMMAAAAGAAPEEDPGYEEIDALAMGPMEDAGDDMLAQKSLSAKFRSAAMAGAVATSGRSAEAGDFYVYTVDHPVTVKPGQSALVPILSGEVEGKRVALYRRELREDNPMTAIRFKNTTGLVLEGGPLTVYSDEEYLGEAMLNSLKMDEEALLPFAVESGCRILVDDHSETRHIFKFEISNSMVKLTRKFVVKTSYQIDNSLNERELSFYLDHPIGYELNLQMENEPIERTSEHYRFRFDVAAGENRMFTVEEHGERLQTVRLQGLAHETVDEYVSANFLPPAAEAEVRNLIRLREELQANSERREALKQESKRIDDNQKRMRENLSVLGERDQERELRERYLRQMATEEDRIRTILAEIDGLDESDLKLKQERNELLKKISFKIEV